MTEPQFQNPQVEESKVSPLELILAQAKADNLSAIEAFEKAVSSSILQKCHASRSFPKFFPPEEVASLALHIHKETHTNGNFTCENCINNALTYFPKNPLLASLVVQTANPFPQTFTSLAQYFPFEAFPLIADRAVSSPDVQEHFFDFVYNLAWNVNSWGGSDKILPFSVGEAVGEALFRANLPIDTLKSMIANLTGYNEAIIERYVWFSEYFREMNLGVYSALHKSGFDITYIPPRRTSVSVVLSDICLRSSDRPVKLLGKFLDRSNDHILAYAFRSIAEELKDPDWVEVLSDALENSYLSKHPDDIINGLIFAKKYCGFEKAKKAIRDVQTSSEVRAVLYGSALATVESENYAFILDGLDDSTVFAVVGSRVASTPPIDIAGYFIDGGKSELESMQILQGWYSRSVAADSIRGYQARKESCKNDI